MHACGVVWCARFARRCFLPVGGTRLALGDALHNLLLALDGEQACNLWWWLCARRSNVRDDPTHLLALVHKLVRLEALRWFGERWVVYRQSCARRTCWVDCAIRSLNRSCCSSSTLASISEGVSRRYASVLVFFAITTTACLPACTGRLVVATSRAGAVVRSMLAIAILCSVVGDDV